MYSTGQHKTMRLGLSHGTWHRIMTAYHNKESRILPKTESREFYDAMAGRGIFKRHRDRRHYILTDQGKDMAEWLLAILPQRQVRIRWKRIPR